ncbi:MAG TPA: DEAD/DEAH box helicase [Candidatus Dormibacteraeota bacterium]|nr:DEAD/DEAH box helicase [Candidatus Dormibacteraeota bacterium]
MAVLHGLWSSNARLALWMTEDLRNAPLPRGRAHRPHPFTAGPEDLKRALGELSGHRARATPTYLTLLLPSGIQPRLLPWSVPAIALETEAALDLFLTLPLEPGAGPAVGDSLRFLAEVGKLGLELAAQGRLMPSLDPEGGRFSARWQPHLEPADVRRLHLLAKAMPPVCRAEVTPTEPAGRSASRVVRELVETVADMVARRTLAAARPPARGRPSAPEAWLRALFGPDPAVAGDAIELGALAQRLKSWQQATAPTDAPLRLCFRVAPPAGTGEPQKWQVDFLLQARDDPSLLVPASEVWRSKRLVVLERAFERPQELLLAELGRASRLWPDLEPALAVARPAEVSLDTQGAYRFLRDSAALLSHSGFGVQVPPWWYEPQARLGMRLRARPAARTAGSAGTPGVPGRMGLEALVDYRWEAALGDDVLSAAELRELARLKVPLVQVRGRWVELRPDELASALALLNRGDRGQPMTAADLMRTVIGLDAEGRPPMVGVDAEGWVGDLLADAVDRRLEPAATPPGFKGILRPYQERGLAWLGFLGGLGLGACLADDMGLGKTVQVLALLQAERSGPATATLPPAADKQTRPTLLICPMSVVGNWQREAERFAPALRVHVHHGSERLAGEALADAVAGCDLFVTTYGLVVRDQEALAAVPWDRIVLDEAQNIKNSAARQTKAVRALPAGQKVALTGTPVENRLTELWSIMEFLNRGLLGSASDFRRRFAVPIERYRDESTTELLKRITRPFVLRRLKTDRSIIADLPEKVEMKVFCNITREQATLYQAVLDDMLARIDSAAEDIERRGLVLAAMMKLKQCLNHPVQLLRDGSKLDGRSGKLARLEEVLEEVVAEGDRALVFTQFAEMGELLRGHLVDRLNREVLFLHGGTPKRARDEMVARFQAGALPVFILSLKAGGTGLNLTAANHVIHFDRWWNPAVEDQATDRAFRIGQTRGVQVRKLVCVGTLEERIDQLIEQKRELADRIVGSGESWLTELSTEELRDLVALSADAVAEG